MPTYQYECRACDYTWEDIRRMVEMDIPCESPCPNCGEVDCVHHVVGGNYAFMSPEALGRKKAPEDFRNFLSHIKKANPGCYIKDR